MNIETANKVAELVKERKILRINNIQLSKNEDLTIVKIPKNLLLKVTSLFKERQQEIDNQIKQIEC